jgi:hypothetical protein
MRTDGQTDMTKLIVALRSFTNAPESGAHFNEPKHLILLPWPCGQNIVEKYEGKLPGG